MGLNYFQAFQAIPTLTILALGFFFLKKKKAKSANKSEIASYDNFGTGKKGVTSEMPIYVVYVTDTAHLHFSVRR